MLDSMRMIAVLKLSWSMKFYRTLLNRHINLKKNINGLTKIQQISNASQNYSFKADKTNLEWSPYSCKFQKETFFQQDFQISGGKIRAKLENTKSPRLSGKNFCKLSLACKNDPICTLLIYHSLPPITVVKNSLDSFIGPKIIGA